MKQIIGIILYSIYIYECAIGMYTHGNPSMYGITLRQMIIGLLILVNYTETVVGIIIIKKNRAAILLYTYYIITIIMTIGMSDEGVTVQVYNIFTNMVMIVVLLGMYHKYSYQNIRRMLLLIASIFTLSGFIYVQQHLPKSYNLINVVLSGVAHQTAGQILMYANAIFMYFAKRTKKTKYTVIIAINTILILLTGARTAMIVNIIATMLLSGGYRRKYIVVLAILFMATASIFSLEWTMNRWERLSGAYEYGDVRSVNEVDFRLKHTEIAWELFIENPIFGIGPGNWNTRIMNKSYGSYYVQFAAHSPLDMLVHQGLVGVLLFYSAMIICLRKTLPKKDQLGYVGGIAVVMALLMTLGGSLLTKWEILPLYVVGVYYSGRMVRQDEAT